MDKTASIGSDGSQALGGAAYTKQSARVPDSDDDDDVDDTAAAIDRKCSVDSMGEPSRTDSGVHGGEETSGQRHVYDGMDTDDEDEDEVCVIS